jgi:hypothetical protein
MLSFCPETPNQRALWIRQPSGQPLINHRFPKTQNAGPTLPAKERQPPRHASHASQIHTPGKEVRPRLPVFALQDGGPSHKSPAKTATSAYLPQLQPPRPLPTTQHPPLLSLRLRRARSSCTCLYSFRQMLLRWTRLAPSRCARQKVYALRPTPYALHTTPYTLRPTHYALHPTP